MNLRLRYFSAPPPPAPITPDAIKKSEEWVKKHKAYLQQTQVRLSLKHIAAKKAILPSCFYDSSFMINLHIYLFVLTTLNNALIYIMCCTYVMKIIHHHFSECFHSNCNSYNPFLLSCLVDIRLSW